MSYFEQFLQKSFRSIVPILFFCLLLSPNFSFGEDLRIVNPIPGITSVGGLVMVLIRGLIKIGIPFLVIAIIWCGFLFVAAQGNPEKITKARDALLYTAIGAAVLLGSWGIAELITETVSGLT